MGLFSGRRRLPRSPGLHLPIRFHSQFTLRQRFERAAGGLRSTAVTASNDARVVGVILVLAAAALAVEMAASFK